MMSRVTRKVGMCVLAAAVLAASACAGRSSSSDAGDVTNPSGVSVPQVISEDDCQSYNASPGITEDEIKLGSTYPDSGPLASIGEANKGMEAYFEHLNQSGGINGRTVTLIGKDDQYDPTKAQANVNELLQEDEVFAIVGVQSTTGAMAVWDQLEAECVPILESTISSATTEEREDHLNAVDGLVPYASEAYAVGSYLTGEAGAQKVAVIAQSGSFSDAAMRGLEKSIEDNGAELVGTETFQVTDPTVRSQMTTLADSDADALMVVAAGTKCPQIFDAVAETGWDPMIGTLFTCSNTTLMGLAEPTSTDGIISDAWVRRRTAGDQESDTYFDAMKKYAPKVDADSENVAIGWAQGEILAKTLSRAPALTRVDVINSALALQDVRVPMAADGVKINTSETDTAPVETVQINVFDSASEEWSRAPGDREASLIDVSGMLEDFE